MRAAFVTPLMLRDDGGLPMTLAEPLVYDSAVVNATIVCPAGMQSDFASIPRGLWNIFPQLGRYDGPAVLHDYLYRSRLFRRDVADHVFLEALRVMRVPRWQAWLFFLAVRLGGGIVWRRYRQ